jgi:hypothetical protein
VTQVPSITCLTWNFPNYPKCKALRACSDAQGPKSEYFHWQIQISAPDTWAAKNVKLSEPVTLKFQTVWLPMNLSCRLYLQLQSASFPTISFNNRKISKLGHYFFLDAGLDF